MRKILAAVAAVLIFGLMSVHIAAANDPALDEVAFNTCNVTHPPGYGVVDFGAVRRAGWTVSACMAWPLTGPFTGYGVLCWSVWGDDHGHVSMSSYAPPFSPTGVPNPNCPPIE